MIMLAVVAALPLFSSCNNNDFDDSNYPAYYGYVTLATDLTNNTYWFISDSNKKIYPGDTQYLKLYQYVATDDSRTVESGESKYPLVDSEGKDKNGRRVLIYYNLLEEKVPNFDYNISLYRIYDILSKTVEVANTEDELKKFGDVGLNIGYASLSGDWVDTQINVVTATGAKHVISLVDNKYQIKNPVSVPSDYLYLELHQSVSGEVGGSYATGNVSFKLPEQYNPAKQGKKGLYIGFKDLNGTYQYVRLENK